ncbi:methyl-accepting chemotaxis protein [Corallococcus sp. AB011P]|uniref:methyl-accepting chemotaxis protein n=1 Tax=unclassified Corallococcus TaxID=2685029 RepID=UPI000EA0A068|nr:MULTISPECIES: methyl-accepting chemotaxis protein [unclassified Corallococcus]RKG53836.1 methyl-accepting chemotaxis protein [Corallococcus sp. AB011P]RKH86354.1 methyl-accepting chemotaxis protein [Corallococcus sp. AB045]
MWGRLTLRMQVAIAVLLPCLAVVFFTGVYFPARQKAAGLEVLVGRAATLGTLVVRHPSLALPETAPDARARRDELFNQVASGGFTLMFQELTRTDGTVIAVRGQVPKGDTEPKELKPGACTVARLTDADQVVVRCESDGRVYRAGFGTHEVKAALAATEGYSLMGYLGAAVLGLGLAVIISRAIADPVSRVTQVAREVARGDVFRGELDVSAAGEVRQMATSFNEMLSTLRSTVMELVTRTEQLSSASRGLMGASADQEHVISQQAAYAQQIAATFEELSRTAEQISSSTEVVESSARRTHDAVAEAMAVVAQVVGGINDIRTESKGVADAIVGLNKDLQQVSKIAQVINQVAERSDLLALNAALEGTKAGDVGRGFSLVAAEMRKLAENVSVSARDIARIVEKVQDSGEEAASKARVGMATSDRGVEVAEQASAVFLRIVELARGTSEAARQITIATRQQRQSSEQAVQGARNVADLVKQGVDATGRTTRIAQDLQAVAEGLTAVTSRFKAQPRS